MDWINEYFIGPILANGWYNPVNTLAYSVGLVIGVWLVYHLLMRMKVPIDNRFILACLPFIFWGSTTRVLHDAAVANALSPATLNAFYSSPVFPTPGSYFITFGLALLTMLGSLLIQRYSGTPYWKVMLGAGTAFCAVNILLLPWLYPVPLLMIVGLTAFWTALFWVPRRIAPGILTRENVSILSCHLLDASATFTALALFGYLEQHVLPRTLITFFSPVVMFPLKILVVIPVLFLIDRHAEKKEFRVFLKLVVLILGLAPGLRDAIRLVAGV